MTDSVFGPGTLTLTITQKANAAALKGTWSSTINGGIGGTIKGSAKNGTATINLKSTSHHHGTCIAKAAVTILDPPELKGNYTTTGGCKQKSNGSFDLTP